MTRTINGTTVDVHKDNPAEELNYRKPFSILVTPFTSAPGPSRTRLTPPVGDPSQPNTDWYGYPLCFTVGDGSVFTDTTFHPGDQFLIAPNETFSDTTCSNSSIPPRLSLQAHSAPIDATFDSSFANMYVTLHGSWNREPATGYKVVRIPFTQLDDGAYDPVAASDDIEGYDDVMWNEGVEGCTGNTCLRPSGITWDRAGTRMFIASDNARAGELFVLYQVQE